LAISTTPRRFQAFSFRQALTDQGWAFLAMLLTAALADACLLRRPAGGPSAGQQGKRQPRRASGNPSAELAFGRTIWQGLIMERDEVIATLRKHESELRAQGVVRLGVFGSVARGEANQASDVDLVIAFDEARNLSLIDQERVRNNLGAMLGTEVDLAVEPLRKPRLRQRVEAEAVFAF
jgi:predicted nucleotidyltransferase